MTQNANPVVLVVDDVPENIKLLRAVLTTSRPGSS